MVRILAFAGSARDGSWNKRLAALAAERARNAGADVTLADLREYEMPLYDGDLEASAGLPEGALRWKALLAEHQAFLIACPEYNSSITPLLKNAIDWASRPVEGEAPLAVFRGKVAALLSASPGNLGGLRGLVHVRSILGNIGVHVVPGQLALPAAHRAFDEDGTLADGSLGERLEGVVGELVHAATRLHG